MAKSLVPAKLAQTRTKDTLIETTLRKSIANKNKAFYGRFMLREIVERCLDAPQLRLINKQQTSFAMGDGASG